MRDPGAVPARSSLETVGPWPPAVADLIRALRRLPGIGTRNAERMALAVLSSSTPWPDDLATALRAARDSVHPCTRCGFYAEASEECQICSDATRDPGLVCVVETPNDVIPIEKTRAFRGRFHCLGGKLSPLDGVGPSDLTIDRLLARIQPESVREVILALGTDVEGETTALFLAERLISQGVRVTRLARGLPLGGSLDVADALTLGRAFTDRREF